MKREIRRSVFETNSSATHALTVYTKEYWEKFKNGECIIDESWHKKDEKVFESVEEVKNSKGFSKWLDDSYEKEDIEEMTEEDFNEAVHEYMQEEGIYSYEDYEEMYEILEEEIPDSAYVAVSIYSPN